MPYISRFILLIQFYRLTKVWSREGIICSRSMRDWKNRSASLIVREYFQLFFKKEAQARAFETWVGSARARTEEYNRNGPTGPAIWILTHGKKIPQEAIEIGKEQSWSLYTCRAYYEVMLILEMIGIFTDTPYQQ